MNFCFNCKHEIQDNEGIKLLYYFFCSYCSISKTLTPKQLKRLCQLSPQKNIIV